jgi:hypothetical protein
MGARGDRRRDGGARRRLCRHAGDLLADRPGGRRRPPHPDGGDGQWADPSSLRALDFLARRIADLPALPLVALRPQEPGSRVELLDELRGVAAGRVSLGALRPESVARLVRERIPEASDEVCDACHAATAGNPLYLQELLRSVTADEVAPEAATVLKASLPTLGDRVIRRVERLDDDAPALARAMAVLGNGSRRPARRTPRSPRSSTSASRPSRPTCPVPTSSWASPARAPAPGSFASLTRRAPNRLVRGRSRQPADGEIKRSSSCTW